MLYGATPPDITEDIVIFVEPPIFRVTPCGVATPILLSVTVEAPMFIGTVIVSAGEKES